MTFEEYRRINGCLQELHSHFRVRGTDGRTVPGSDQSSVAARGSAHAKGPHHHGLPVHPDDGRGIPGQRLCTLHVSQVGIDPAIDLHLRQHS